MSSSMIDAAFRATTYRVSTPVGDFALRIDRADARFDDFLSRQPVVAAQRDARTGICWGIVTAYNPGTRLPDDDNHRRQQRLCEQIMASAWSFFPACNLADDGAWPEEPSYLVLHADEEQMAALGREFGQRAVVCGRTGLAPRLLWL